MSLSHFRTLAAAIALFACVVVLGQEPKTPPPDKKPPVVTVDIPLPDSLPAARTAAPALDPELRPPLEAFFARLKEGKVNEAYQKLLENSRIGKEPAILEEFITKTTSLLKVHGKVEDVELIRVRTIGKNLREITYQLSAADHPSRWRIFAYHGGGKWQILDIDVSSDLTKMVD